MTEKTKKKTNPKGKKRKTIKSEIDSKILRYLSYKPRTLSECEEAAEDYLEEYDLQSGEQKDLINEILAPLIEAGYIDDEDYAYSYIVEQQRRSSPRGPYYIYRFLLRKGISREVIDKSLKEHYPESKENECIEKLVQKKKSKSKPKLINYLLRRGFSKNLVYTIVDSNNIKS